MSNIEEILEATVRRQLKAGVDREIIIDGLEHMMFAARYLDNEEIEEAAMFMMDRLTGWCSAHMRL